MRKRKNNLGVLYGQQGRNGDAEALFRQAVENNPQYGQAFMNLGLILAAQERFAEAAKEMEKRRSHIARKRAGVDGLGHGPDPAWPDAGGHRDLA